MCFHKWTKWEIEEKRIVYIYDSDQSENTPPIGSQLRITQKRQCEKCGYTQYDTKRKKR